MSTGLEIFLIFFFFFFNLIVNWLFTYKVYLLSKEKFVNSAIYGALATTLSAFFFSLISLQFLDKIDIWFILLEIFALATSSYMGTIIIPRINQKILKEDK